MGESPKLTCATAGESAADTDRAVRGHSQQAVGEFTEAGGNPDNRDHRHNRAPGLSMTAQ
jgi:hypothetical protein